MGEKKSFRQHFREAKTQVQQEKAWEKVARSGDPERAPEAALYLGVLLAGRGVISKARAAYQQAADSGHREHGPAAAFNLGNMLRDSGDREGARAAYQQAVDSGHRDWGPACQAEPRPAA